jgi:peptidoglycan hydrolase-like protein with peptidoglycan-binding domain
MSFLKHYKTFILITGIFLFLFFASNTMAANIGDIVNFNVDKGFDASGRTQDQATLIKIGSKLYFYVEKSWWDLETPAKQAEFLADLDNLSNEFDNNIYPTLTSAFGSEWNPGIDKDPRITVLFESMNSTEGGYFREDDEYEKLQSPDSNEREMVYISTSNIDNPNVKIILGHEFTHLITFNQKNKNFNLEEDTWLNEARADYSSSILGYDDNYDGSNLQQRVKDFIDNPSDSITDWNNTKYDYASIDLFTHYLVDHYGINILSDSLKSKSVGIESINQALLTEGYKDNFAQIFTNWTIALAINDCSQNKEYCYLNKNLSSLRVSPTLIFLPLTGDSSLSSTDTTKNWAGNWQKIIGGSGSLELNFSSLAGLSFQVPYIVYDKDGNYSVKFLSFSADGKSQVSIQDFGIKYKSLIIIPSLQTKISGFDGSDLIYPYSFTVSIAGQNSQTDQSLIQKLLAQIDSLKAEIAKLQQQQGGTGVQQSCSQISVNLYFGVSDSSSVKCLQEFLKNQGASIYPEGFVTGIFGNLTKAAVIKFQEKYAADILTPIGLSKGSGYVGAQTRMKINMIINGQ